MVVNAAAAEEKASVDIVDVKTAVGSGANAKPVDDGFATSRRASAASAPSSTGHRLPPLPKPTRQLSSSLTATLEGGCSREGLRQDLRKRRSSLLPKEVNFLEDLLQDGEEDELNMAREKLSDESLFFDRRVESSETPPGLVTIASGSPSRDVTEDSAPDRRSDKVEEYRQSRRQSEWHGKMWKAHENGLAVTKQASRRSMFRRSSSRNLMSKSTKGSAGTDALDLVSSPSGIDSIVRPKGARSELVSDDGSKPRDIPSSAASSLRRGSNGSRVTVQTSKPKRTIFRQASNRIHKGEGIEVLSESMIEGLNSATSSRRGSLDGATPASSGKDKGSASTFRQSSGTATLDTIPSFDDNYRPELRKVPSFLRETDDAVVSEKQVLTDKRLDSDSWEASSDGQREEHYDPWNILNDEYAIEYLGGGTLPFRILGTSIDDLDAVPHVLSPPLMESLQNFFPYAISEENFWMRYSLVKHGACIESLLPHIRGARYTVIAVETTDGEVFGSFTGTAWKNNGTNYFGSGEAFLWRMRKSRNTRCFSIIDQAQLESELDVFPWTGDNDCVQLCSNHALAVGGGSPVGGGDGNEEKNYGFGFALDPDLVHGTTSRCVTFGSPPLSRAHKDGSPFEVVNVEVWTTTPCYTLEDAEKLQFGKLFLERHATI